jgi:hypothetical protein
LQVISVLFYKLLVPSDGVLHLFVAIGVKRGIIPTSRNMNLSHDVPIISHVVFEMDLLFKVLSELLLVIFFIVRR